MLSHGPLSTPDATMARLIPERQEVALTLALFGAMIRSSVAFKSGGLRLVFVTGAHLNVRPDPQYEAWSARGPGALSSSACRVVVSWFGDDQGHEFGRFRLTIARPAAPLVRARTALSVTRRDSPLITARSGMQGARDLDLPLSGVGTMIVRLGVTA
jgi:hypothetical protein